MKLGDMLRAPVQPAPEINTPALPAVFSEVSRINELRTRRRTITDPPADGEMLITMIYHGIPRDYCIRKTMLVGELKAQVLKDFDVPAHAPAMIVIFGDVRISEQQQIELVRLPMVGDPPKAWLWVTEFLSHYRTAATVR